MQGIKTLKEWWIGWGVFGIVILFYFAVTKVVNFRLHRALGRDAPVDEPEEDEVVEQESKEEGGGEADAEKERMKEELQAASQVATAVEQSVRGSRVGTLQVEGEPEEEVQMPLRKKSPGLPEPPSFMQETSEEVAKSGGVSLSRSSSGGHVKAVIELSTVERTQEGGTGVLVGGGGVVCW